MVRNTAFAMVDGWGWTNLGGEIKSNFFGFVKFCNNFGWRLWDSVGCQATFYAGRCISAVNCGSGQANLTGRTLGVNQVLASALDQQRQKRLQLLLGGPEHDLSLTRYWTLPCTGFAGCSPGTYHSRCRSLSESGHPITVAFLSY